MNALAERGEWALHRRMALACEAATDAGLPGQFRAWTDRGVPAVEVTDPALSFLSTRTGHRLIATNSLDQPGEFCPEVVEAEDVGEFVRILLAGYQVDGPVAAFISAEHHRPEVQRYLLMENGEPIAAAAMTIHEDVAVLGGASTLPDHRGKGAQKRLLLHRLALAAESCTLAVASAQPDSVSAANLQKVGFQLHQR